MFKQLPWTRDDESRGKHTGTFGEVHVWKRIKDGFKETAVVKIPTVPQHIEKLRQERDKMLQISHRNIVKCLNPIIFADDFNLDRQYKNGIVWKDVLVMEYCDSGNLRKVFNHNRHGIGLREVIHLCSDLGSALQYLHEVHHIIHRDIKPENVFLAKTNDPMRSVLYKLGDMGEVTEVMKSDGMTHVSTLQTHGTFAYMAPEQLLYDPYDGTMKMAESTDLWGFGTILSEAAFGVRPFFHDQGHHIHCDISSYCTSILDKSDDTIYIFKDGAMRDATYIPVNLNTIPHNNTLPEVVVLQMYRILKSALLSDRRKRGHPVSGSYQIYDQICDLTDIELSEIFDCGSLVKHYIEILPGKTYEDALTSVTGFLVSEDLEIDRSLRLKPGFQLYLAESSNPTILPPKLPDVLETYFSEPFPSHRKGVERALVGFLLRLKHSLDDVKRSIKILMALISHVQRCSNVDFLAPTMALLKVSTDIVLQQKVVSYSDILLNNPLKQDLQILELDIGEHTDFIRCWCETFRGLSSKTEWTDIYILVDNFKGQFLLLGERYAKLSSSCYNFIETVQRNEKKCKNLETEIINSLSDSSRTNREVKTTSKSNIRVLLEENTNIFNQLKLEMAETGDIEL